MKYTLYLGVVLLLLAGLYATAQPQDSLAHVPMTRVERAIMQISNPNDLKRAYDTLTTPYNQQWFINALPKYFAYHKSTAIPAWINQALLDGMASKTPLLVIESVRTAGALKIQCADNLIALYPTIHSTFGCNEFMLKGSLFTSMANMDSPNKQQFLYNVLTKEQFPLLDGSFGALLRAVDGCRSAAFDQKLSEYSAKLTTLSANLQTQKDNEYEFQQCKAALSEVDRVRNNIAQDAAKGGAK